MLPWISRCGASSVISLLLVAHVAGQSCFSCRSQGIHGNCRDPFLLNMTLEEAHDVEETPCASEYCIKIIKGDPTGEDQDLVIERKCLQRPPLFNNEACTVAAYGAVKGFRCICRGSLCNTASMSSPSPQVFIFLPVAVLIQAYREQQTCIRLQSLI